MSPTKQALARPFKGSDSTTRTAAIGSHRDVGGIGAATLAGRVCDLAFVVLVCIALAGISPASSAQSPDSGSIDDVESITILPIALSKAIDVEDRDELQQQVERILLRKLAVKGYVLDRPRGWRLPSDWSVEALKSLGPAALAGLAPKNARHVALLYVELVEESGNVVSSSARTAISASILDTSTGAIVWHKASKGEYSENAFGTGLFVMVFTPDKYFALERAFASLFNDFPERPDR